MNLHFVGGFLGSGKTTAIIHAAKSLMDQGQSVGVITNDQGKYLVDTAFFRLSNIPAVEVTGGCFCCNYDDLDGRLGQIIASSQPDVIFAESVGSCADIVATVVRPLQELGQKGIRPTSFSVFADARLLRRRLLDQEMPFSDDVVYIYDKQLEEAGWVVVNKTDLLSEMAVEQVRELFQARFPGKPFLLQSSLSIAGIQPWLAVIQSADLALPQTALDIDYARYGAGEARLAWLDEELRINFPVGEGRARLRLALTRLTNELDRFGAGIGHLKLIVESEQSGAKLSFPTISEPGWEERIPEIPGESARLLVNARVEMNAEALRQLVQQVLRESGFEVHVQGTAAFHPPQPHPTHRIP